MSSKLSIVLAWILNIFISHFRTRSCSTVRIHKMAQCGHSHTQLSHNPQISRFLFKFLNRWLGLTSRQPSFIDRHTAQTSKLLVFLAASRHLMRTVRTPKRHVCYNHYWISMNKFGVLCFMLHFFCAHQFLTL